MTDAAVIEHLQAVATERQLVTLSLGAGVQSTTLALMAESGELPRPDVAVFADTGWEPASVYEHLERLTAALSFPVLRVQRGNMRDDLTKPGGRFVAIPYYTQRDPGPCSPCGATGTALTEDPTTGVVAPGRCGRCRGTGVDDGRGIGRRQCTNEYKLTPIRRLLRQLLGAKAPDYRSVPRGRSAVQWIGFSTDEVTRANRVKDSDGVRYLDAAYPLLELGMSRTDCNRWLRTAGWGSTAKSACIGCPFHGNAAWRELRDTNPTEWADAVQLDEAIRKGGGPNLLDGTAYLHASRVPLALAPIDRVTRREWADAQVDIFDAVADAEAEQLEAGRPMACSPFGCDDGDPEA